MEPNASLVWVGDLAPHDRDAMFALMAAHYDNTNRPTFDADLAEKRWVIQRRSDKTGALCGFSTQMLLQTTVEGRAVKARFSRAAVIDR